MTRRRAASVTCASVRKCSLRIPSGLGSGRRLGWTASATLPGVPDREATCLCGQLRLEVTGEPFAVSICNCLACKRGTGSAFGMQGFRTDQVRIEGRYSDYSRVSDEADRKEHILHFCPECGSQVFYTEPTEPDFAVVSVGSFADPSFPPPTESGYDSRRHPWIGLPESMRLLAPELWWTTDNRYMRPASTRKRRTRAWS